MKIEVPQRKGDQKSRKNDINLEARKTKRKSIRDTHLRHHHQAHLMTILMGVNIEIMRARKSTDSRFRVVSEEDQYKYSLPPDRVQYANVNFDTYIKEPDLIKAVLIKNPVPENINPVKTLNDFVKNILKGKKKQKDLDFDNVLERIQGQNRSVMGPLSKIWTTVESARLSQEDSVKVDLKEIQEFVEQTVLLLGQVSNSISYYRMFYVLLALTNSPQQSKQMLREDSELLQKNDKKIFRKKCRGNIWHTCRSKKQTIEMLSNTSRTKYKPFRHGLPQTPRRSFVGQQQQKLLLRKGTTSQSLKKRYSNGNQNSYGYGYGKY